MSDLENIALKRLIYQSSLTARERVKADRSSLWVRDRDSQEMWTVIPSGEDSFMDIRIAAGQGYVGLVVETEDFLNIPFDFYDYADSKVIQESDRKVGYRTCSLLLVPIFGIDRELVGVIQLINKCRKGQFPTYNPAKWPQAPDRFKASFNLRDRERMIEFSAEIGRSLQDL